MDRAPLLEVLLVLPSFHLLAEVYDVLLPCPRLGGTQSQDIPHHSMTLETEFYSSVFT